MNEKTIRLVIAEDQTMTRETMARILGLEDDIEVVGTAADGQRALAVCHSQRPTVLLTDINMPIMNGIQLTRALHEELPEVGVVILTIYGDDDNVFAAVKAGARGYVLKDSPPEEAVSAIRKVAQGEWLLNPLLAGRVFSEFARTENRRQSDSDAFRELTEREREVLTELGRGKRNKEIAETLFITEKTVKNHISHIFEKLEINSRAEAALLAARQGLV
jgi:DNA-binding NarL/FixJ family response regulator